MEARVAFVAAILLPIIFALAFAREAMRSGLRFPRGWHSRQRYWRKWVVRNDFSRSPYHDNRLARVLCYDEFIERDKNRRARFYAKDYGFFYAGEKSNPGIADTEARALARHVILR